MRYQKNKSRKNGATLSIAWTQSYKILTNVHQILSATPADCERTLAASGMHDAEEELAQHFPIGV